MPALYSYPIPASTNQIISGDIGILYHTIYKTQIMITNFKNIHIGKMIKLKVTESEIEPSRICNFMKCREEDLEKIYSAANLETDQLLRWSKLLEYDFFRMYSQHLILYAPPVKTVGKVVEKSALPNFRKNIYTKEIIDFILEQIRTGEMTIPMVMEKYNIPKTTLYKWISKYKS